MDRQRFLKSFLTVLGVIAVVLGVVGILLPRLPTTPFLLLAAACFMRSSDRLYRWLIRNRWLGDYIRNYREHRAMTLRAKVAALTVLWGVIGYSAFAVAKGWWLRGLLSAVAAAVTAHLLCLRTLTRDGHAGDRGDSGNGEELRASGAGLPIRCERTDLAPTRCRLSPTGGGTPMVADP